MLRSGSRFTPDDARRIQDQRLICVQNGIHFVNFLADEIEQCHELAKKIFESEQQELHGLKPELAKHRWLQDYIIAASGGGLRPYMGGVTAFTLTE